MKPILFNAEMVKAILDGRKTVTRRVIKQSTNKTFDPFWECYTNDNGKVVLLKAPYSPGDILYVRETWRVWRAHRYDADADIQFKAGGDGVRVCFANGGTDSADREDYDHFIEKWYPNGKWRPSIHMPKEAARIFLRVKNVRVERLQNIDEDGVCAEGAEKLISGCEHMDYSVMPPEPCYNTNQCEDCIINYGYPELFGKRVWNDTIKPADRGRYGWDANPWVWVIEFERCEKPKEDT